MLVGQFGKLRATQRGVPRLPAQLAGWQPTDPEGTPSNLPTKPFALLLLAACVPAFDLRAPPPLLQIPRRLAFRRVADLHAIIYRHRPGRFRHPRRHALMLHYAGLAVDRGHAPLYAHRELVLVDLGFC